MWFGRVLGSGADSLAEVNKETLSLRFRSCFLNFQIFDSDLVSRVCLYKRRLQTTNPRFQNHEWTRTKLRIHWPNYEKGQRSTAHMAAALVAGASSLLEGAAPEVLMPLT